VVAWQKGSCRGGRAPSRRRHRDIRSRRRRDPRAPAGGGRDPKPGNVDRHRDLDDLRFEAFLGGAVGAREGLELAADGETGIGRAFERGVSGMAARAGTNTQFGCLLLLVPLVRASVGDDGDDENLFPASVDRVTRETTVDDAVAFYRAFEHVDVAVADPPPTPTPTPTCDAGRRGPALRERDVTLRDVMALSADPGPPIPITLTILTGSPTATRRSGRGFPRTFRAAEWIQSDEGPMTDRAARAFLGLLAAESDTLVAANHGPETAREASERAAALLGGDRSTSGEHRCHRGPRRRP